MEIRSTTPGWTWFDFWRNEARVCGQTGKRPSSGRSWSGFGRGEGQLMRDWPATGPLPSRRPQYSTDGASYAISGDAVLREGFVEYTV